MKRDLPLWAGIAVLLFLSLPAWQGSDRDLSMLGNFLNFWGRFWPPDFSDHAEIREGLLETLQIGFLATLGAGLFSLLLGLAGGPWMPRGARASVITVLAAVRSVPSLIWAVMAVAIVGPVPRAGVLALAFYSVGYLGKFLMDDFLTLDLRLLRTYQRWGLSPLTAFQFGFWPQLKRRYLAHCLWMLEYNIRSAAIIGYVGAGGLGLRLHAYQEYGQWSRFAGVLVVILAIVLLFELFPRLFRYRKQP